MPPHGCQLNGMGAVHDGAVFVLADVAFCGAFQCERPVLHECPDLHFFCAFRAAWALRGEARVLRSGKLLSTYEVRVTDAEGALWPWATITGYGVGARLPLGDA